MNILITGSSSGIGETIARRAVAAGHRVVLMARRVSLLQALAEELNGPAPGRAVTSPGDVGNSADCERAVKVGLEAFGDLDALVNAAGTWVEAPFAEVSYEEIQRFVHTDITGALQISRALLPHLQQRGGGRILHLNGLQGLLRQRPPVLYAAVESAVRGLCESLRWEVAGQGVHVGLITLGSVANAEPDDPAPAVLQHQGRRQRLSRGEVAEAVLFMLSRPAGVNVDELVLTPLSQQL
ncbi:MAG: SDR family NAD(P)-dependent oxidoreductase [Candidatus Latescibacteria bacterium]|nr:SDR family NAD(P)-dependent oxidoreductase [Candidatus Latescibacterota bacterium]